VRFQDLRELTATVNSVTEAMTLDAADAKIDAGPGSAEEVEVDASTSAIRQETEL
jgi:hypothetical protein